MITVAQKQAPIVMSLEYKVRLLDHDFPIVTMSPLHTVSFLFKLSSLKKLVKWSGYEI